VAHGQPSVQSLPAQTIYLLGPGRLFPRRSYMSSYMSAWSTSKSARYRLVIFLKDEADDSGRHACCRCSLRMFLDRFMG